jgi:ABC transporter
MGAAVTTRPGGAWRVMATLTTHRTLELVELRSKVDPRAQPPRLAGAAGARGPGSPGLRHQPTGLELRPDDPAGVGSAGQTSKEGIIIMSGTPYHQGGEPLLVAEQVRKVYRTGEIEVEALTGLDLTVPRGEMVAVMGPSGSGKTTLLNCLSGLDDKGSSLWGGRLQPSAAAAEGPAEVGPNGPSRRRLDLAASARRPADTRPARPKLAQRQWAGQVRRLDREEAMRIQTPPWLVAGPPTAAASSRSVG